MKKIFLLILLGLSQLSFSQTNKNIDLKERKGKFYKTYEDLLADKPVEGIKLHFMDAWAKELELDQNGTTVKIKNKNLLYSYFYNFSGDLIRVFDGEMYRVFAQGSVLCFYVRCKECDISTNKEGNYEFYISNNQPMKEYYSEGIKGDIIVLKNKVFEEYLEKYGLLSEFDKVRKPKREFKDNVREYQQKELNVRYHYKKLLIEKMG